MIGLRDAFNTQLASDPHIYLYPDVLIDISLLVETTPTEVAWFGIVERDGIKFTVTRIIVPYQDCAATTVEIPTDAIAHMISSGDIDFTELDKLRMSGHSHVNMGVSPSGTDNHQLDEHIKNCEDYFISCIANKGGILEFTINIGGLLVRDCKWSVYTGHREGVISELVKERVRSLYPKVNTSTPVPIIPSEAHMDENIVSVVNSIEIPNNSKLPAESNRCALADAMKRYEELW